MLLSITNHRAPATDLGYLLHKNPAKLHQVEIAAGSAYVFYPVAEETQCTAVLMLDIDPVSLVRELRGPTGQDAILGQYVNDRPYVASSFMSVAISRAYSSALKGQSRERPELTAQALPLTAELAVIRASQGERVLPALFEPLGYTVDVIRHPLDAKFPEWGESRYFSVRLSGNVTVQALLKHLYVLIPVLDDDKHYWVSRDEVDKLLRAGEGWLKEHPARDMIMNRYLRHQRRYVNEALAKLLADEAPELEAEEIGEETDEAAFEKPLLLNERRLEQVAQRVIAAAPARVIDLGCGEGKLIQKLLKVKTIAQVWGMDVSTFQLSRAASRLRLERMSEAQQARLLLFQGSLIYRDERLKGFDVATLVEVIEHLDPPRLAAFERVVFRYAQPRMVIITTPNVEYNALYPQMPAGAFRHKDHRFEWTRAQFAEWAQRICMEYGYTVEIDRIGDADATAGTPTQMGVFRKAEAS